MVGSTQWLTCASMLAFLCSVHAANAKTEKEISLAQLAGGFSQPPAQAKPQVWWHWMNGNVSQDGADLDLDWLAKVGVGGVHIFSGALLEPTVVPQPLTYMSTGWNKTFHHAVERARSLGMEVTIAGSPGWSETGGPWVRPVDGMKKLVWRMADLEGGRLIDQRLPTLPSATGPIQSLPPRKLGKMTSLPAAGGSGPVVAFRSAGQDFGQTVSYRAGDQELRDLASAGEDLTVRVPVRIEGEQGLAIDARFARQVTIHGVQLALETPVPFDVLASLDGTTFTQLGSYAVPEGEAPVAQQTVAFAPTNAVAMRIVLHRPPAARPLPGVPVAPARSSFETALRLLRFSSVPLVSRFESKAGFEPTPAQDVVALPEITGIAPEQVVDLTDKVSPDGHLRWQAPSGRWTIVRFGWSLTGQTNAPAEPEATGLEVDKFDADAVKRYIDTYFESYEKATGTGFGQHGIGSLLTDSWEAGVQNWTPGLPAAFRRLRGYDPTPWWPVLAGLVVKDRSASDNFLADFRQTLKDLVVTSHYQVLAKAAHERGMSYYTEVQGDLPRAISDGLTAKGQADIPTAEYWFRPFTTDPGQPPLLIDLKEAASAAHLYGHRMAAAEALTMAALGDPWSTAPNQLKPVIDRIFALGINRILIHDSHHQPFVDRKPGLQLGIFGQWFNRNESWAGMAKPWVDYLARTSFMLQQGRYVADVAYLYGEEASLTALFNHDFNKAVPAGFAYDYMDAASLKSGLKIEGGAVSTESGMHYRVLYLGREARHVGMDYLSSLRDLVQAGAVLVGEPPEGRLGLKGSDAEFTTLVHSIWPEAGQVERHLGRGRVVATSDLGKALAGLHVSPDVVMPQESDAMWLHRALPQADVYYLSNQAAKAQSGPITFRTPHRRAQWWSPETGKAVTLPVTFGTGGARISLDLLPHEAGFVVFGDASLKSANLAQSRSRSTPPVQLNVDGPWDVSFQAGRGAPDHIRLDHLQDLSTVEDPGVRYFSGEATYSRTINVPGDLLRATRLALDLGEVREVARVSVNGQPAVIAWHTPYRVEVTGKLEPGSNRIEITVANLWVNRLIGDRQKGASPVAYAPQSTYRASSSLVPSGLIGPVRLRSLDPIEPAFEPSIASK